MDTPSPTAATATGTATDKAANSSTTTSATIKRDTLTPDSYIYSSTGENPLHNGKINAAELAAGALDQFFGEAYDASSGVATVTLTLERDDGLWWTPGGTWGAGPVSINTTLSGASIPRTRTWQTALGNLPAGTTSATSGWQP